MSSRSTAYDHNLSFLDPGNLPVDPTDPEFRDYYEASLLGISPDELHRNVPGYRQDEADTRHN